MITAKAIVSVPLYNEEKYIESTLICLKKVPRDVDVKFFISDNKSTDNSFEIIRETVGDDERFWVHQHEKNLGAAENFSYVYFNSKSDYFMWLGGHDLIDPGYVLNAIEILDQHKDACYAAGEPYAFYDTVQDSVPMKDAVYQFSDNRLIRYLQSVATLNNCTIVNSMFRRKFIEDMEVRTTVSNDHVLISHLLWHGKIYYTPNRKYYRRFFKEQRESREERVTADKTAKMERFSFLQYYIDDFKRLYNQPGEIQDYLCQKILAMLEKRFSLESFDPPKE